MLLVLIATLHGFFLYTAKMNFNEILSLFTYYSIDFVYPYQAHYK